MANRRSGRQKRAGTLAPLSDVLHALCQEMAWDQKVNEMALLALWPHQTAVVAGLHMAKASRATGLRKRGGKTILLVEVSHAALASELSFSLPALKDALNRFSPQTGITVDQIQLKVGMPVL